MQISKLCFKKLTLFEIKWNTIQLCLVKVKTFYINYYKKKSK